MTLPIYVPQNNSKQNRDSNNMGHRCESYPCYYCNPDIFFSNSPNSFSSMGCIEKKLWLQQEHISSSLSSTSSIIENEQKTPVMVDAEVQITPDDFVIIDESENLSRSQDATTSTSNLGNLLVSKSSNTQTEENEIFSSLSVKLKDTEYTEDKEDKDDTNINDSVNSNIDMVFDLEYSEDESPVEKQRKQISKKQAKYEKSKNEKFIEKIDIGKLVQNEQSPKNEFDYETFDGEIDSLPDSVFYDIADALMMQQSIEF